MSIYAQELRATAQALVARCKGVLAIDKSNGTCNKRFLNLNIPTTTEENRRAYRDLVLTTPQLSTYISGPMLFDETLWQTTQDGKPFGQVMTDAGMIPRIKVDTGTKDLAAHPSEKVTEGLNGLLDLPSILAWGLVLLNGGP